MVLWITVGLVAFGIVLVVIDHMTDAYLYDRDELGGLIAGVSSLLLVFMLIALAINYIGVDADIANAEAEYNFLVAQYESGVYEGSTKMAQYNLLQKIGDWNRELTVKQKLTHNFWIGVFLPDYYDDLKHIAINLEEGQQP